VITDLGSGRTTSQAAIIPTPSCFSGRRATGAPAASQPAGQRAAPSAPPPAVQISLAAAGSGRVAARSALYAALTGVRLSARDRQFLSRLAAWDKRNAESVASLLRRARQAGRDAAALTPRQLEVVLAALSDAAAYRSSGGAASGCWDCENIPGARCADHMKDNDRARAYSEAAAALSGTAVTSTGRPSAGPDGLPQPRDMAGYRHRAPVAS
jgi:hypothetical protein